MGIASTSGLSSEISMNNFLTLFVTQLQNQNPLDPTDNSEFMSQLAQFSALEQEQQQTKYLSSITSINTASLQLDQLAMAGTFIGKTIKYSKNINSKETLTGVVEGVRLEKDGTVSFVVNGKSVSISDLIEVVEPSTTKTATSSNVQSTSFNKN